MEKTLNTIQLISKICKILSKVFMVFAIVSACLCTAAEIMLVAGIEAAAKIGNINIHGLIEMESGMTTQHMYIAVAIAIITSVAMVVLFKFMSDYFSNELEAGTPFTLKGASEMFRLGIIWAAVSVGVSVVSAIVAKVMGKMLEVEVAAHVDMADTTITTGILLIAISFILKYGAEREEQNAKSL